MSAKIKNYCYKVPCGPVVKTGFNLEQYFVCRECKEEVTESLADRIKEKTDAKKEVVPEGNSNDDFMDMWASLGGPPGGAYKRGDPDPEGLS